VDYGFSSINFGALIREYRNKEGLSLGDLAERTQLSKATLSRIENGREGKFIPDTLTILMLAKICELKLEDIFQSDDAGKTHLHDISVQLRASKEISPAAMDALEAVIRAVRLEIATERTED
jgi:transcriptional regulator with XRE-family HTH domain